MKQEKIKVYRTTEGNVFELVFLAVLVIVWALIISFYNDAPDIIPTHFDFNNQPNGYGSKNGIFFPCIVTSIAGVVMMVCAYFPHTVNLPVKLSAPRQYALAIRMLRILGIVMLLLTLAIGWTMLVSIKHGGPTAVPVLAIVGVMLAVIITFTVLIHKAK